MMVSVWVRGYVFESFITVRPRTVDVKRYAGDAEVVRMFRWLRRWRERALERQIERLLAENRAFKAEWRKLHGDEPPRLTDEERRELREKRDRLSPEVHRMIEAEGDFFGLDEGPMNKNS